MYGRFENTSLSYFDTIIRSPLAFSVHILQQQLHCIKRTNKVNRARNERKAFLQQSKLFCSCKKMSRRCSALLQLYEARADAWYGQTEAFLVINIITLLEIHYHLLIWKHFIYEDSSSLPFCHLYTKLLPSHECIDLTEHKGEKKDEGEKEKDMRYHHTICVAKSHLKLLLWHRHAAAGVRRDKMSTEVFIFFSSKNEQTTDHLIHMEQ